MLREISGVQQDRPGSMRRWFQDDFFDLFVWLDGAGKPTAFQLAYDRSGRERVIAWSRERGFVHSGIDDGEESPLKDMSPLFVADGVLPASHVCLQFAERSGSVDEYLRQFVLGTLRDAGQAMASDLREH